MTPEDREREPFRWCVYCDADCDLAVLVHGAECPSVTGLYPVRPEDLLCHGGCGCVRGMACTECGAEFSIGEFYTYLSMEVEDSLRFGTLPSVVEMVCLGCAAIGVVSPW